VGRGKHKRMVKKEYDIVRGLFPCQSGKRGILKKKEDSSEKGGSVERRNLAGEKSECKKATNVNKLRSKGGKSRRKGGLKKRKSLMGEKKGLWKRAKKMNCHTSQTGLKGKPPVAGRESVTQGGKGKNSTKRE